MVNPTTIRAALAVLGLALAAATASARPLTPAEKRYFPFSGRVPLCDASGVLERITSGFADREGQYWESGLTIVNYDRVSEIGLRSTGLDHIPRRYCIARVQFNTGAVSTVNYQIVEDSGFIGFGYGVDWCVEGLDRQFSFAPACKQARP